jgi:hypothetical protein
MTMEKWERTSPFGILPYAYEYRAAAQLVHNARTKDTPSMPAYSLMGRSLELALKSFLRARGLSVKDLRGVGHDLAKAFRKARELGLRRVVELHDFHGESIDGLSDAYRNHRFRYIENGMMSLPKWDWLDLTASLLIVGLHDYAIRATFGRDEGKRMLVLRPNFFSVQKQKAPE